MSVNVFSTKVRYEGTIFYVIYCRRGSHFTWPSEARESLAFCRAKTVHSFVSYFRTLRAGPAPGIEPTTCRSRFLYTQTLVYGHPLNADTTDILLCP